MGAYYSNPAFAQYREATSYVQLPQVSSSLCAFSIMMRLGLPNAARQLSPAPLSAVHRGVAFEERSLHILQTHLSMSLCRVGGKSDGGIDLQGWWWLPTNATFEKHVEAPLDGASSLTRRRVRVLAQCKAEKKKISPHYVREMEGVLHRYLVGTHPEAVDGHAPTEPVVGLLVSASPFTKAAVLRAQSSPIPFLLMHLSSLPEHDTEHVAPESIGSDEISSVMFNPALGGSSGLLRGEVEPRWERPSDASGLGRPGLWLDGCRVPNWVPEVAMEGHSPVTVNPEITIAAQREGI